MSKYIHIVSFNIPTPPNYGGVIDVYYKLIHLHKLDVKIILHTFLYNRNPDDSLLEICEKVYYYKRNTSPFLLFSTLPYIVVSRKNDELLNNLQNDKYPILFEGLHCCYYINHPSLQNRTLIYRESNIEHDYYKYLARAEKSITKKIFYYFESIKLKNYEEILSNASVMLAVSTTDRDYLKNKFQNNKVEYLPSFHSNNNVESLSGKGNFILFHGNLSVAENEKAAMFLIKNVFSKITDYKIVIAGLQPSERLENEINKYRNITLIASPDENKMNELIYEAHIHVMYTFQATGLKLKLLNTLYKGRFIIANDKMVSGTSLSDLCIIANNPSEIISKINTYFNIEFSNQEIEKRNNILQQLYNNQTNAVYLQEMIKN